MVENEKMLQIMKKMLDFLLNIKYNKDGGNAMTKMGRPKGTDNKEYFYGFRMNKDTHRRLEAYCKHVGVSKSEAIRRAIEMLVEEGKGR